MNLKMNLKMSPFQFYVSARREKDAARKLRKRIVLEFPRLKGRSDYLTPSCVV